MSLEVTKLDVGEWVSVPGLIAQSTSPLTWEGNTHTWTLLSWDCSSVDRVLFNMHKSLNPLALSPNPHKPRVVIQACNPVEFQGKLI